jgi:hypothetical protein
MAKMNVTEKDFDAFFQATESIMSMSGTLDEGFDEEAHAINRQFKSFERRYLKAKNDKQRANKK